MGGAQIISTLVIGQIGNSVDHKYLMLCSMGLMCMGMASVVFLTQSADPAVKFAALLGGYSLYGLGFAATLIIPFRQIALYFGSDQGLYGRWYTAYELCRGMLSPGFARVLMMLLTATIPGRWGWRAPWLIALGIQSLNILLVLLTCNFKTVSLSEERKSVHRESGVLTYKSKLKSFYCNPVALPLFISCAFAAVAFISTSTWTPTIAQAKFGRAVSNATSVDGTGVAVEEGLSVVRIQGVLSIASFLG
jgi:MFS family permease